MKTLGLIGGMSWESTASYYRIINETVCRQMGGLHSAQILMYSLDFAPLEHQQAAGDWQYCKEQMIEIGLRLQRAGADYIVICANTMHKVVPELEEVLAIPVVHIADAAAEAMKAENVHRAALLGTVYTMEQDFYRQRLAQNGIEVMVPERQDRELINGVIFQELCCGKILASSKRKFSEMIDKMKQMGAEGVILGCTEIGLLVEQKDSSLPVFDTAVLHAVKAARLAMGLEQCNISVPAGMTDFCSVRLNAPD